VYAICVDFESNRHMLATTSLGDCVTSPMSGISDGARPADQVGGDEMLSEATHPWLVEAFVPVVEQPGAGGNMIVTDAEAGSISATAWCPRRLYFSSEAH
jgi:hypothetical protein